MDCIKSLQICAIYNDHILYLQLLNQIQDRLIFLSKHYRLIIHFVGLDINCYFINLQETIQPNKEFHFSWCSLKNLYTIKKFKQKIIHLKSNK